jgi:P-type Cu+ transporter
MIKKTFSIVGMHCAGCAGNLTKALKKVTGVVEAQVTYATDKAIITYDEKTIDWEGIKRAVSSVGKYQILLGEDEMDGEMKMKEGEHHDHAQMLKEKEIKVLRNKVMVSLGIFGVLMAGSILKIIPAEIAFVLTTIVMFYGGAEFFVNAWMGLRNRSANMDTLVAMGTGAAYLYSSVITFFPSLLEGEEGVYFETAAAIVGLILLGRYLEARAKAKAGQSIKELLKLQAKEAIVVRKGKEIKIGLESVVVGDVLVIKPGSQIPVDGVVIEGESYVDESLVTGESKPVKKRERDRVIGSTMNTRGKLMVRAMQIGEDTFLSRIVKMVQEAQSSQAPIQKLADRVSGVFVPVVIGLAVLAFVVWYFVLGASFSTALTFFITVLIISCPCALGLATPIAIMVGTERGARMGILIKNAEKLQLAGKIDTLVFDKTGTLTKGNFAVTDVVTTKIKPSLNRNEFLTMAASVEKGSEHPIGEAIVKKAKKAGVKFRKVSRFRAVEGKGVEGKIGDKKVKIGTRKYIEERKRAMDAKLDSETERLRKEGKTVVYMSVDKRMVGAIALADEVKNEAKEAVRDINDIDVWMMTGDNKETALGVAGQLGIENVLAEVLPKDKAGKVKNLKEQNNVVAMVGDGVNDAPALAVADVGIAMATGTEVAMETADITLVRGEVALVSKAISLSRKTMRVIGQNFFWAFGYNIALIPVAAGALVPLGLKVSPILASGAMAFSSLSVVLNSLRLRKVRI